MLSRRSDRILLLQRVLKGSNMDAGILQLLLFLNQTCPTENVQILFLEVKKVFKF